ncbi:MAG: ComEC/Rec2 family competence protein [Chitinophagaceae bacterium]|nr:ComEC/Rec2 family competence protein [Chitinophagaceae bacterium]
MAFRNKAVLWEYAPALRVLIPLVIGIILYDRGNALIPESRSVLLLYTTALLLLFTALHFFKTGRGFVAAAFPLLWVGMGIILCYAGDDTRQPHWMGKATVAGGQLMGVVRQQPQPKQYTLKVEVAAIAVLGAGGAIPASGNALVYMYPTKDSLQLNKGDTILLAHQWEPVQGSGNPFGLNYPQYCRRKNIHLQQFTDRVVVWGRQAPAMLPLTERLRLRSLAVIQQYIHDPATAALLEAMLMGEERNIDPDLRQAYSDTGIIHIISISGAHIAILFFAISFGFRRMGSGRYAWIQYTATVTLIWFYISIAGLPVPAIRAAGMFTMLALGHLFSRQHHPLNQLFATAVLMLLLQPMWLFSIGFQLSFVAVLSLALFYKPLLALCPQKNKIPAFFVQALAASIAAEILVAPLVAYYFHSFPLMFLAANLVAGLPMSLILCLGLLLLLLAKISSVAQLLAVVIVFISGIVHRIIHILHQADLAFFKTLFISPGLLLALYLLVFCLCMFRQSRAAVWGALVCLLLISTLTFARALRVQTQKRLIVFQEKSKAHAELLVGDKYHLLAGTPSSAYGLRMTHIGFGANRAGPALGQDVLLINGRRIVLADSTTALGTLFPADILLVVSAAVLPDSILTYCRPRLVVCAAGNRKESSRWARACGERKLAFHSVRTQGAFIFP